MLFLAKYLKVCELEIEIGFTLDTMTALLNDVSTEFFVEWR